MNKSLLAASLAVASMVGFAGPAAAAKVVLINRDAAGQGLNDPTVTPAIGSNPGKTVGAQRRIVYQFAMDLYGSLLQSNVDVKIYASFAPLPCDAGSGVLGEAGPNWIDRDFPGAPLKGAWYVSALADSIAGVDLDPSPTDPGDIVTQFNADLGKPTCLAGSGWYYGLDGNTPAGQINFLNVVMHEINHGFGFLGLIDNSTGALANFDGTPRTDPYTHLAYDNVRHLRFDSLLMDNSAREAAITTPGRTVWSGAKVTADAANYLDHRLNFVVTAPASIAGNYAFGEASFGPTPTAANFTGTLQTAPSNGCAAFSAGLFAGKIALIDRGSCAFTTKTKNAQNAGATAVVIADNNPANVPPPGLGGSDPTVTIPAIRVTTADGNTFKANMPVSVTFSVDPVLLMGADNSGRVRLYAPTVVAGGSTFSHWDTELSPNAVVEPFINGDLAANIRVDLGPSLLNDIGWQMLGGNAKIRACDTGVPVLVGVGNIPGANINAADDICVHNVSPARASTAYKACMTAFADNLVANNLITPAQNTSLRNCIAPGSAP
jgi:hypothetical protein